MANHVPILYLFSASSFFLLVRLVSPHSDRCFPNWCGYYEPPIRFPFRLKQFQPDERCVYPGFDLSCNARNQTTLNFPSSGEFIVDSIDYVRQVIWLRDPDHCLPERVQNFSLSGSDWTVQHYTSFTLFKCRKVRWVPPPLARLACLEGHNHSVVAVATDELSQDLDILLELRCGDNWTIQIPSVDSTHTSLYRNEYSNIFGLTWTRPSCGSCEELGGMCRFKGKKGLETKCTIPKYNAGSKGENDVWWIFLTIGIPCITFIVRLLCYISCKRSIPRQVQQDQTSPSPPTARAQAPVAISGMDTPTIESYPKTQIGDGGASMPCDSTCSICLSEYRPEEMVRTIPECKHSFHAHCIDPWLKRNATCPLCRNHPGSAKSTVSAQGEDL